MSAYSISPFLGGLTSRIMSSRITGRRSTKSPRFMALKPATWPMTNPALSFVRDKSMWQKRGYVRLHDAVGKQAQLGFHEIAVIARGDRLTCPKQPRPRRCSA